MSTTASNEFGSCQVTRVPDATPWEASPAATRVAFVCRSENVRVRPFSSTASRAAPWSLARCSTSVHRSGCCPAAAPSPMTLRFIRPIPARFQVAAA